MRILVTGASGFMGLGVTRALCRRGHEVWGLFRSPGKERRVVEAGAVPLRADLSSSSAAEHARQVDAIVHCAQPDVYATHLTRSAIQKVGAMDREWVLNLLTAAAGRARTFLYPSGGWVYGDTPERAVDERAPLNPFALASYKPALETLVMEEGRRLGYSSLVVFRSGALYGPGGGFEQFVLAPMRGGGRSRWSWVGSGNNWVSYIHVDDFAEACALALEKQPGHVVLNVTDDEPVRIREAIHFLARQMGARPPGGVPSFVYWLLRGAAVDALTGNTRMDNRLARSTLQWAPKFSSYREGFSELARQSRPSTPSRTDR